MQNLIEFALQNLKNIFKGADKRANGTDVNLMAI